MKIHHAMKSVYFLKNITVLNDNYFNCKKRFNSLNKRFEGNNEMLPEYNKIIKEQHKLNIVEKVPSSEINNFDQVENIHLLTT